MHFAIGTTNHPKSEAIEYVLGSSPYTSGATFSNHRVASGVSDMPTTLEEIRIGAKNRALECRHEKSDADYFVGMEGGVYRDFVGDECWLTGVVYVEGQDGIGYFGYSAHLRVPDIVVVGLFDGNGRTLNEVMTALGEDEDGSERGGAFGAWTDGMITRRDSFIQAMQCAIVPFFNRFYQNSDSKDEFYEGISPIFE